MSLPYRLVVAWLRLSRRRTLFASEAAVRAGVAAARRQGPPLPGWWLRRTLHVEESAFEGHRVLRLRPRRASRANGGALLLYLHGGGYVYPITSHHWRLVAELVTRTGCEAVVPLYPLAPEHACEYTLPWAQRLYAALAREGRPVVLGGDSAGSGLALALAQSLRGGEVAAPTRLLLITPAVDWTLAVPEVAAIAPHDPLLMPAGVEAAARMYAGAAPLSDPRVSPLRGPLAGLPPTFVLTAGRDILAPGGQALAARLRAAGTPVQAWHAPQMVHDWPLLPVPEGRGAGGLAARRGGAGSAGGSQRAGRVPAREGLLEHRVARPVRVREQQARGARRGWHGNTLPI